MSLQQQLTMPSTSAPHSCVVALTWITLGTLPGLKDVSPTGMPPNGMLVTVLLIGTAMTGPSLPSAAAVNTFPCLGKPQMVPSIPAVLSKTQQPSVPRMPIVFPKSIGPPKSTDVPGSASDAMLFGSGLVVTSGTEGEL